MSQADDRVFIRRFSGIILGLVGVTVVIIVLAVSLRGEPDPGANPSQVRFADERIAPVAAVRAGAEGEAALARSAPAAALAPAGESAAADEGQRIYQTVCFACHGTGAAGAPMPGSEAMSQRHAEKGTDGLVASAINGLNVMPPRGGRPDLTDEQIRAAVEFMLQ